MYYEPQRVCDQLFDVAIDEFVERFFCVDRKDVHTYSHHNTSCDDDEEAEEDSRRRWPNTYDDEINRP